jgi:hypothetical protein
MGDTDTNNRGVLACFLLFLRREVGPKVSRVSLHRIKMVAIFKTELERPHFQQHLNNNTLNQSVSFTLMSLV